MKDILKIGAIQAHLCWENPIANKANFTAKINEMAHVDVIILPEMFTTGFTMNVEEVAEEMDGESIRWMQQMAKKQSCAITGSLVIKENNKYYNRLVFMRPDGKYNTYDKQHLFTLAKENEVFTAGQNDAIITYKGWKIKLAICYDLRFPVWSRNTTKYDLLLYVASWPKKRIDAWDTLLKARAIENMCFTIGVNRIGLDGMGYEYNGHSAIYNALGASMIQDEYIEKELVLYTTLALEQLKQTRKKLGFLNDMDAFKLL